MLIYTFKNMKQAILDTNFILTCIKQKIDFFEELKLLGIKPIIPKQVIRELQGLKKPEVELSIKILNKNKFKEIDIGKGHVDNRIMNYLKEHEDTFIATLDREIKKRTINSKIIIKEKKRLEII